MTTNPEDLAQNLRALIVAENNGNTWFDASSDPELVETVGKAIASSVADPRISAVVGWFDADQAVLTHVVARELGVPRAAVDADLGLLNLYPRLRGAHGVLVLTPLHTGLVSLSSLKTFLERAGHTVIAAIGLDPDLGLIVHELE